MKTTNGTTPKIRFLLTQINLWLATTHGNNSTKNGDPNDVYLHLPEVVSTPQVLYPISVDLIRTTIATDQHAMETTIRWRVYMVMIIFVQGAHHARIRRQIVSHTHQNHCYKSDLPLPQVLQEWTQDLHQVLDLQL